VRLTRSRPESDPGCHWHGIARRPVSRRVDPAPETYTHLAADGPCMDTAERTEIGAFTTAVAAESVTPSGGACAAVAASLGAALCEMGCRHASTDDRTERRSALATHRERLLELADEDAMAVDALLDATGRGDGDAIAAARRRTTEVPLEVAEAALAVLEAAADLLEAGTGPATADVHTGAVLAHAAARAALTTVRTNLEAIGDPEVAEAVESTAIGVAADVETALDRGSSRRPAW